MRTEILNNLDNPRLLEQLYRDNSSSFKREFNLVYPEIQEKLIAQIWHARINFKNEEISWGTNKELIFILVASFIAGLIAKIPDFTGISQDQFYTRNIAFIVFPLLTAYFAWKNNIQRKSLLIVSAVSLISVIYINVLPVATKSDTLNLACIHLPLFLWAVLGFAFVSDKPNNIPHRLDFLRYNADLVVMTTIIIIAGALLTAITINLFNLIDIKLENYYFKYIGIWGLAAAPIFGTYLVQTNPQLVHRVSPVIAKVFTPLVLITLVIYLFALLFTGKDPYNDREFLLIFNLLLIGVMAIILFSIAEISKNSNSKIGVILLFALSAITVIVNGIALSAIVFRISEWGITPNRLAVLGGNVLILANLLIVTYRLFKTMKDSREIMKVENSIASFLPIYVIWIIFMTFIVPLLFNFK
ncbi:hypothetical protein [Flavihumibacter fluvii]|uniref:hypothetical protein n=1 Tax=Flavihumibacter fluvii TaxID=2838157 RepID=UPI001BDEE5E3|nr:hypothetical protein [Flavihumibacter fluvii]ULQ53405.1 hypothetical protein KJS93_03615 [Flavihumibacter fluvii]